MPTIRDLPPETIEHIVTNAYSGEPATSLTRRARKRFLRAVALVGHVWTPFAQEALWKYVELNHHNTDTFLAAGPGRHPVHVLNYDEFASESKAIGSILSTVQRVKVIRLLYCSVDPMWLCGDNLRELTSLELFEAKLVPHGSIALSFSLTTLMLNLVLDPGPSEFLQAISRQSSITDLSFKNASLIQFNRKRFLRTLAPLAPQVVTLGYGFADRRVPKDDGFLKHCTQLKHLTTYYSGIHSSSQLLAPLESWCVERLDTEQDFDEVLDVFDSKSIATSKLERLEVQVPEWAPQSWERWSELEEMCRERKIELSC